MSVVIETTLGDITVDLYLEQRPATCLNFLKLCKMKYYNFNLFHTIRNGFIAQTGDPTGEGSGGESIWGLLEGSSKRFFSGEKMPKIRHTDAGLLSMVCTDDMMVGSQFFFTLAPDLDSLDGVHCVIGEVTEGHEVLSKLNEVICDETHRPYQDVRITHTVILEDPFNDIPGLRAPSRSPSPSAERLRGGRIAPDEEIDETQGKSHQEIQEIIEEKEAKARATILEIVGDLPDADIAPPENVLFVCKLNPVTTDDDLEIIFSRFGKIVSCEVIRDKKTGDSLQYAFIEFEDKKSCEDAYFKMDNVLIDDRRIHVDFSQSVSKMRWLGKGRGVQYFNEKDPKPPASLKNTSQMLSRERNDSRRQHYKDREISERDDRDKSSKDDRHNNFHRKRKQSGSRSRMGRSRSRSLRKEDSSNIRYTKSDRNHSDKNYSRELKSEKTRKHSDSNTNKHENRKRHESYDRNHKLTRSSPDRYNKEEYLRSPKRNEEKREKGEYNRNNKIEKNNDKHSRKTHRSYEKDAKDESNHSDRKHGRNRDGSQSQKKHKRSKKPESQEEPHTPSPPQKIEKDKRKSKNNIKKTKNKRKPLTSSSESETSDSSSSSSSESSSTSGEDKRKKRSKRRKRCPSSSSSSSSTSSSSSSTSSSSNSSSESSVSSSESDSNKKRCKTKGNTKTKRSKKKL